MSLIIEKLLKLLPKDIIFCFNESMDVYRRDYSHAHGEKPLVVLKPFKASHLSLILKVSREYKVPLYVRGSGTGKTGGCIPLSEGIVVSMEDFNKIIDIDFVNSVAVVEPGVITYDLQLAAVKKNLFFPPDPASLKMSTIGGNIAENAGGPRTLKYGVTSDYVLGLEGFFANGEPFSFGGAIYKNVAGYNINQLLVGSEGTLGIVTKAILKLIPNPTCRSFVWVAFQSIDDAIYSLGQLKLKGVTPSMAELMDSVCLNAVKDMTGEDYLVSSAMFYMLYEVDGFSESFVERDATLIVDICKQSGSLFEEVYIGDECPFLERRRLVSLSLNKMAISKVSHDVVVPISTLKQFFKFIQSFNIDEKIKVLAYGHLGDGNLHVNILNLSMETVEWEKLSSNIEYKIMEKVIALKGSISGEHGIGCTKSDYMSLAFTQEEINIMKLIKDSFDPYQLLNPGKIFK
ncbi:glycolate oxidase subunit GlcD [Candidatus Marinamargulisbacteria bacterium SCGC AG-410-N11]|nr:glycolate oxidase subunit GlcD [Candidatus Marinamargulisbacteria bacterium SCGC AG-410-N11]